MCGTLMRHVLYSLTAVSCSTPQGTSELFECLVPKKREGFLMNVVTSFPVSDIKRTLDAMSWVKVCSSARF